MDTARGTVGIWYGSLRRDYEYLQMDSNCNQISRQMVVSCDDLRFDKILEAIYHIYSNISPGASIFRLFASGRLILETGLLFF